MASAFCWPSSELPRSDAEGRRLQFLASWPAQPAAPARLALAGARIQWREPPRPAPASPPPPAGRAPQNIPPPPPPHPPRPPPHRPPPPPPPARAPAPPAAPPRP